MTDLIASLTRSEFEAVEIVAADLRDAELFGAYMLISMRLRLRGSIQYDDRALASIARCTPHTWTKRVWPRIGHLFEMRDGCLYLKES